MGDSEIRIAGKVIQEVKELFGEGEQEREALEEVISITKKIVKSMVQQPYQNARSLGVEKVMELVKNDMNYCSEEYVGSLEGALKGVQLYLKSF